MGGPQVPDVPRGWPKQQTLQNKAQKGQRNNGVPPHFGTLLLYNISVIQRNRGKI